ncbi:MAG: Asp23/Gls24 family envelope stress response protein [Oscillospiraceae bacterium]|jgi:uncharacterized alkaline shock family protein YloU|nr:Asp23/Gls24 family envelope stress response protein [Oscillospiraceae bacterium]
MKIQTDLGTVEILPDVFTSISGWAANNCFGVKGMASRSVSDGFVYLLRRENLAKGVKVSFSPEGTVSVELHIVVEHGVNIPAASRSIIAEVRYLVEKTTGVPVDNVEVCVDSIMAGR